MRGPFWRRLAAVVALDVGIGVAAPVAQASAHPVSAIGTTHVSPADDWWW